MNVLSLFDGMSCGQIALERSGIKVNNYYASEIDKYAQIVSKANYPNTIYLGDVRQINSIDLPQIDLLIGGSPCQSFSFAGKRKGMSTKDNIEILTLEQYLDLKANNFEFEGQSYLFWEYVRILKEVKPKYFLLENVLMVEKWEKIISKTLGVNPIMINSALVSAQNRKRLYWTNIGLVPGGLFGDLESIIEQPKDKGILIKDVLEKDVDVKYFLSEKRIHLIHNGVKYGLTNKICDINGKSFTLSASMGIGGGYEPKVEHKVKCSRLDDNFITTHSLQPRTGKGKGGKGHLSKIDNKSYCVDTGNCQAVEYNKKIRRLTPLECERLQTVNDNYTNHVSDSQRYKMLGNGWTIDVIAHIFSYLVK